MVGEAATFAEKARRDVFRKGTDIPCITHPLEVAVIVSAFMDGEKTIVAVLLHDVMEDTGATKGELEEAFGTRVACLMMDENEDKGKTWQERKGYTVRHLGIASRDVKILALGSKLNNIRGTARDYLVVGDAIWQRFSEKDKKKYAWYYWGIAHVLKELERHVYYQKYIMLHRNVFGPDMCPSGGEFPHNYNSQGDCE